MGAPRCGTTALCRYLATNPQICFSRPKEPHYFSRISALPSERELQSDYIERYFGHRGAAHRVAGEGSVSYLYMPGVIERIRHFNPAARFVVMLRNPMTMLPSYHLKMRFMLLEDEADFAKAWGLQDARARGESVPRHCLDTRLLMYREVASFGTQLERLFDLAGRERTHVVVLDDFQVDPLGTYRKLLAFLRVDDDGRTWFPRKNESRIYRFRWLQERLYLRASRAGRRTTRADARKSIEQRVARKVKLSGLRKKKHWIKSLTEWNWISAKPAPLTPEMRAVVADTLRPDIELLSRLLQQRHGLLARGACLSPGNCLEFAPFRPWGDHSGISRDAHPCHTAYASRVAYP